MEQIREVKNSKPILNIKSYFICKNVNVTLKGNWSWKTLEEARHRFSYRKRKRKRTPGSSNRCRYDLERKRSLDFRKKCACADACVRRELQIEADIKSPYVTQLSMEGMRTQNSGSGNSIPLFKSVLNYYFKILKNLAAGSSGLSYKHRIPAINLVATKNNS